METGRRQRCAKYVTNSFFRYLYSVLYKKEGKKYNMNQKYLNRGGLITLITLLSMIPPLSIDLYMPALPQMTSYFKVSTSLTSFTMTVFFIFMAIGILVLGSISDKFGRKPVLVASILISLTFSIICAISPTISLLIIARAIQAFGAGGMVAIATALIKDSFEGKEMSKILSITQAFSLLAPMIAPILGALILKVASWKMVFIVLALLTSFSLFAALLLQETLSEEKRITESSFQSIFRLVKVTQNKNFSTILLIGGLLSAPFMAYLAIASYIYINEFGVSETTFSLYFALTSSFAVLGPILYMRFGNKSVKLVFNFAFSVVIISALLLYNIGHIHPLIFILCYIPFVIVTTYFRPMVSDMLLSTQKSDVGAASAVVNFVFSVIGSVGMTIGSMKWNSYIQGLSYTMLIFVVISIVIWVYILKSKSIKFDWK
ncbi:Bcr/CflA family efflux MFS transporter [Bacillus cereus]|uniref:Bcr/CflA family efflux MFS transporter n=1 Tax=Bacillus cereus TaxID=1396 RepID=UPI0008FDB16A|nr:Bcr/CflA family efflux MFS transporter [Bacillus cereus]MDN4100365.1 Bcr/CflA family efflux MFS transporter [Bacillus cereus]